MLDRSVHMMTLLRGAIKRPERGAFQHKRARLVRAFNERMTPQWWPFNAPRPRRPHLWTVTSPSEESVVVSRHSAEESVDNEAEIQTAVAVEVENVTGRGRILSWRRTPMSKMKISVGSLRMRVREPTPAEILFGSIDEAFVEEMLLPKGLLDSTTQGPTTSSASPIDLVTSLTHRSSSGIGSEISKMIQLVWQTNYEWVQDLKAGAQGDVSLYTQKETSKLMIVKTIRTGDSGHMTYIEDGMPHEAKILQDYIKPHPNLVEMTTIFNDPKLNTCRIVMDYCDGGDLYDFAHHWLGCRREQIPEVFLLHFIASIGEALAWLHLGKTLVAPNDFGLPRIAKHDNHVPILHRDIKLENIFLRLSPHNSQGLPYVVLGDFGGAVLESECDDWFGTPGYYPPEVQRYQLDDAQGSRHLLQRKFQVMTAASDIYTVAATFCRLILLGGWHQDMSVDRVFWCSKVDHWGLLREFMRECLADNPKARPNTQTLLDLAALLKIHVAAAYHCGVSMPENSWPTKRAPRGEDDDCNHTSTSTIMPWRPSSPILPRTSSEYPPSSAYGELSPYTMPDSLPAYRPAAGPIEVARKSVSATEGATPTRKNSSVNRRITILFEIVERMANQFPGFSRTSSFCKSITSSRRRKALDNAQNALVGVQKPRVRLQSKFSEDSNV